VWPLVRVLKHCVTFDTAKCHIHSISIECYASKVQSATMSRVISSAAHLKLTSAKVRVLPALTMCDSTTRSSPIGRGAKKSTEIVTVTAGLLSADANAVVLMRSTSEQ